MKEFPEDMFKDPVAEEGLNIDVKRILHRSIRYWYVIVISIAIALLAAFLRNRYATRIYPITSSILIKESKESPNVGILSNALGLNYRNYYNELYILRSYPLIEDVLREQNFGIRFYREGNVRSSEAYEYVPFEVRVISAENITKQKFYITASDATQYTLSSNGETNPSDLKPATFNFGDTVEYAGLRLCARLREASYLNSFKGTPFLLSYTSENALAGSYVGRLEAGWAEEGAGVINLSISDPVPTKGIDFLNGLIRRYQDYDLEKKNQTASRTIEFLNEQLQAISDSLNKAEMQLERFKDKNIITDLSSEALRLYEKMERIDIQRSELIMFDHYYQYLIDYINQDRNLDQIILPSSVGLNDPILGHLVSKMVDVQLELKMVTGNDKSDNPLINDRRRQINEIKEDIIESVHNQKSVEKIKRDFLEKEIHAVEGQLRQLPIAERQLVTIQRNYSVMESLYVFLLQKHAEAGISKAANLSDIVVVNPPMAGAPISPKTSQNYLIGGVAGLIIPLLVFFLIELFNHKIQSREDIEKITSIPFIGGIGHKRGTDNLEVFRSPKSSISESFRALRSNLNYFIGDKQKVVILITSSISGEGKSFTSINLASVMVLSGKKTLILGADLRKPKLFDDFDLTNKVGLSSYLAGLESLDNVIQHTRYEGLDLVSAGPVPPNPSELLLTPRMNSFMAEVRARYDYVIVDSPPLAIVTDAFVLSAFADHALFLVRQNHTPKVFLRTIQEFYTSGKLKDVSLLLNDIYKSGPGYGYGYGYGYGNYYGSGKAINGNYYDED